MLLSQYLTLHGPFVLVFMPVSAKSFALFRQQDIGQLRKGLELDKKNVLLLSKYDGNYNG